MAELTIECDNLKKKVRLLQSKLDEQGSELEEKIRIMNKENKKKATEVKGRDIEIQDLKKQISKLSLKVEESEGFKVNFERFRELEKEFISVKT